MDIQLNNNKGILCVDLDNVLAQTDALIRLLIQQNFGISLKQEDIIYFDYWRCGISQEQSDFILSQFHNNECKNVLPIAHCTEVLQAVRSCFYIYIITGRPLNTRSMSKQWLKKYKVPYDYLLFSENKSAEVKNINFFIEDCREIAYNLAQKGITTILIDYPWNKPILEEPTLIKRVKCWQDIQMIFNNSITQRRKQL